MVALEILTKRSRIKCQDHKDQISNNVKLGKKEALTVQRLIQEVLIAKLGIPPRQIVNDTTFANYTDSKRPDILISEFEYDQEKENDTQFIENLVAYAEAKDGATVDDSDWREAKEHGIKKVSKLKLPFFIVTNGKTSIFYNSKTTAELKLNNNPIREFQTIDIFRLIKARLLKNPESDNVITNVDSLAVISESIFNKKLWELAKIYRESKLESIEQIDFTIGFIALEFFEEKEIQTGKKDSSKIYWSDCSDGTDEYPAEEIVAKISRYIGWLEQESQFGEFHDLMEKVKVSISGMGTDPPKVNAESVKQIYNTINSMRPLHGTGFDLFGAVYEMFATSKEKKDFGEYFTRRHYTRILCKLLLENEQYFNNSRQFKILDPACGTGGFLTEGFKILQKTYSQTETLDPDAKTFLEEGCFWGYDVRKENISRTKLNMFLVGDGHTHMYKDNTLERDFGTEKYKYIITNPPYGAGTIKAESENFTSRRTEVAFLFKIIKLLEPGGKACVILPDGVLENPRLEEARKEFLQKCDIDAIISLPKFAFAPYTKEKTYAVYFTKKGESITKIQDKSIWMYIIDNDGLANSDKRFPTKLRHNHDGWMHDEVSGWVSTKGEEINGVLEQRWMNFDDADTDGTEWVDEKGKTTKLRKGGFVAISKITEKNSYYRLLPEYFLRAFEPNYITINELEEQILSIQNELNSINEIS